MVQDLVGTLAAVLAFAAVLYAPGYLIGYATDLFGFRQRNFADRSVGALATSFCVSPIAAHLIGRLAGLTGLCWALSATAFAAVLLLLQTHRDTRWPGRDRRITALVATGWTAFVLMMLVDAQTGHKLYFSVVVADQSYRIAFTDAVARTGVPPANPLYFAGSPAPMRYFYFWYVLCAAVMKLAHVSARQAFTASTVWAGFGLLATVKLYATCFFQWRRPQRWIALGLLAVTGADLLPAVGQAILQPTLNGNTEWWSVDPIFGWGDSLLWVPHHVASALCCLLGFLLLWNTLQSRTGTRDLWANLLASAAFASAFGLSVYVAFGFALLMAAWLVRVCVLRHPQRPQILRRVATITGLSALLCAVFLGELASGMMHPAAHSTWETAAPTPHLFSLSIRRMIDSELLTGLPLFATLNRTHPILLDGIIRLLLLLPGLAMELGLYGAVLVLLLIEKRRTPAMNARHPHDPHNTALFLTVCGLVMTMFLSSSVITNNDFGYRAVMLPQFFLLLLAAEMLGSWRAAGTPRIVEPTPATRRLLYSLLLLGIAGTVYWAFLLRAWLPIEAAIPQNGFTTSPDDEFQIREAFDTLNRSAARNAVVAFRPIDPVLDRQGAVMTPNEYYQRMLVMHTGRQMLNAEGKCATHFGGDPAPCRSIQDATAHLYTLPAPPAAWAKAFCHRFGVQYLVLSPWDPQWTNRSGWPVTLPTVAREPRFRILACQ